MIKVNAENADYIVEGYISLPEVHRSSRTNMITLVNNRVVKNAEINRVVMIVIIRLNRIIDIL